MRVSSASMVPTYSPGDVVLVTQRPPDLADLERGDLVTFRSPEDGRRALKRVIGLPGEAVVIKDSELYVDDRVVDEAYVDHALIDGYYSRTYTVPAGSVFLLGDNRGNSVDSRDYGPVPARDLRPGGRQALARRQPRRLSRVRRSSRPHQQEGGDQRQQDRRGCGERAAQPLVDHRVDPAPAEIEEPRPASSWSPYRS